MKHKVTMSIEADMIKWIDSQCKTGKFRNRSHGFEYCAQVARDRKLV